MVAALVLLSGACRSRRPRPPYVPHRPAITVRAYWKGADAEEVAEKLAAPLAAALGRIDDIEMTVAHCEDDGCTITCYHKSDVPSYEVRFEMHQVIQQMRGQLPDSAQIATYPTDIQRPPDITVALVYSPRTRASGAYFAATEFANELMQLPTLKQYRIPGRPLETTRVELDPTRLAAVNRTLNEPLTAEHVTDAIRERMLVLDEYRRVIVGRQAGQEGDVGSIVLRSERRPVLVHDVAELRRQTTTTVVHRVNGEPAVLIELYLRADASHEERAVALGRILEQAAPTGVRRIIPIGRGNN